MKRDVTPPTRQKKRPPRVPSTPLPAVTTWEADDDQEVPQRLMPGPWTYGSVDDQEEEE